MIRKLSRKGFTLIELLVVVAIISLLAAILFPVFARARENARRASCMSNLKQIALGFRMYIQDYDEKLPTWNGSSATSANVTASNTYGWADSLQPYLKSTQIFQCPSDSSSANSFTSALGGLTPDPSKSGYTDYWMNITASNISDASFNSPSTTVLLGEVLGNDSSGTYWNSTSQAYAAGGASVAAGGPANEQYACNGTEATTPLSSSFLASGFDSAISRHLTGSNIAFADGHVKWQKAVSDTVNQLAGVYNACTPTSVAGSNPTFDIR
jgi:prepilin-type N-terminal cleavage/methylation domain-containing protein/prepilin-type processing-associated H-X9-DG protein